MVGRALRAIQTTEHRIELTPGARPVRAATRRAGLREREAELSELKRKLEANFVEKKPLEREFAVFLVPKIARTVRGLVEHSVLNLFAKKYSFPLPWIDEFIKSLGRANVFSTLYVNARYWKSSLRPRIGRK